MPFASGYDRGIETIQVIEELVTMAKEFQAAAKEGEKLGLIADEVAFCDELADNKAAIRALGDEIHWKIAIELNKKLRRSTTLD